MLVIVGEARSVFFLTLLWNSILLIVWIRIGLKVAFLSLILLFSGEIRRLLMPSIMGIWMFTISWRLEELKLRYDTDQILIDFLRRFGPFCLCVHVLFYERLWLLSSHILENQEDADDCDESKRSSRVWAQSTWGSSPEIWWHLKGMLFALLKVTIWSWSIIVSWSILWFTRVWLFAGSLSSS